MWRTVFDPQSKRQKLEKLQKKAQDPHLWDDQEEAVAVKKQISSLKEEISVIESLTSEMKDIEELLSLELDEEMKEEVKEKMELLEEKVEEKEVLVYLSGKWDDKDGIIEIHSGAGGRDAEDWAAMLYRMYRRFCDKRGFSVKQLDASYGEAGGPEGRIGLKHVSFQVSGNYAFGTFKKEAGVHRLVRISPFSEKDLRHTSFAKLEVLPKFDDKTTGIDLKEEDLKIDTFRASGPGGQHVNRRETAVRITHKPTGITVSCQSERSQGKNKLEAMSVLKSKLFELKEKQRKERLKDVRDDSSASWGNQIRNYVLHPYKLVKDTRTEVETSNVEAVLEGDLNQFIEAEIKLEEDLNK
ncbi:MAG: peptide chain release factor 2 [Patescibacteria group bacterium]